MHRKPAPSAPNIKHLIPGLQAELACDMIFLEPLGIVERCLRLREIRAGILHVVIKKEAVEIVADIIMVRHVPSRSRLRIKLRNRTKRLSQERWERRMRAALRQNIGPEKIQQFI